MRVRRILHPTDDSEPSRRALDLACAPARDYGAELVICHVSPPPVVGVDGGAEVELPTVWAEEAEARLREVRPADPGIRVSHRLGRGKAVAGLLKVAADVSPDLIVMGSHGRSGLYRMLVGSVAGGVMRKAPCPVVTVWSPAPGDR